MTEIDRALAAKSLPLRRDDGDKRDFGTLLSVCGCDRMPGAAVLSSRSALRSGVGLLRLVSTEKVAYTVAYALPECVICPVSSKNGIIPGYITASVLDKYINECSAVLFGCGLSQSEDGAEILKYLIENCRVPLIIDADGLNILSKNPGFLTKKHENIILTPHIRELARLQAAFSEEASALAEKYALTLVCKGSCTHIFGKSEEFVLNAPNSALSKGGSGDVLAGIIASLASQGAEPLSVAICGVYLHSRAGALAKDALSAYSALPSDVIEYLPKAFSEL